MTLVHDRDTEGQPSVHALVIGVGQYEHLSGGVSPADARIIENMGQLSSPPLSARLFCDWVIRDYRHHARRVATVELLVSDPTDQSYSVPRDDGEAKVPQVVERATLATIRSAAQRWKARGRPDDLMIFFFCGHGVSSGFKTALLASDFAEIDERPWDGAFNFTTFFDYMRSCPAQNQVFFVDACRVASDALLRDEHANLDNLVGRVLPLPAGVQQATYFSTLGGEIAFGRIGHPSLYTTALLRTLNGLGATDHEGYWAVATTGVQKGLAHALSDLDNGQYESVQTPQTGAQSDFEIGRLENAPLIPLLLASTWHEGDEPPDTIDSVVIQREAADECRWDAPWADPDRIKWKPNRFESDLEAGSRYSCEVRYEDGSSYRSEARVLNPPYRKVEIPENGDA